MQSRLKVSPVITLIAVLMLVALVLGCLGFRTALPDQSWLTNVYLSVQLFTFESGAIVEQPPLVLEVARWLAPLTALGGALASVFLLFGNLSVWFRMLRVREHTVLLGLSPQAEYLVADIMKNRECNVLHVVAPEFDPHANSFFRYRNLLFTRAQPDQVKAFGKAQVRTAARVVCATGCDRTNIAIASMLQQEMREEQRAKPLEVFVEIGDVSTQDILQRNSIFELRGTSTTRIHLFNYLRNYARTVFERFPLECLGGSKPAPRPEVSLIFRSLDDAALACLIQAARIGHFSGGEKLKVLLFSERAEHDLLRVRKRYPGIENFVRITANQLDDDERFIDSCASCIKETAAGEITTVYLGTDDEQDGFAAALLLRERLRETDRKYRVLLASKVDSPLKNLVNETPGLVNGPLENIGFLPTLDEVVGVQAVFLESLDKVARSIHQTWYRAEQERRADSVSNGVSSPEKSTYLPWDELNEEQKDVNRFAADHISVKLRAAGLSADSSELVEKWSQLPEKVIETLSRMEHERWAAQMYLGGWSFSPVRNDLLRKHPNLCPYEELDDAAKRLDREQVVKAARHWVMGAG